jgi:hypothetical protein
MLTDEPSSQTVQDLERSTGCLLGRRRPARSRAPQTVVRLTFTALCRSFEGRASAIRDRQANSIVRVELSDVAGCGPVAKRRLRS